MRLSLKFALFSILVGAVCAAGFAALWNLPSSTPCATPLENLEKKVPALPLVEKKSHTDYVDKISDQVFFTMIAIPGGSFLMGSPATEKNRGADEGPQHTVAIPPFWMGKCEVTWDEFDWYTTKRFPNGAPPAELDVLKKPEKLSDAITGPSAPYHDVTFGHGHDGYAALGISHHAAMEYCRWLSQVTGKKYRLPTEAEWEWACRAGTTTAYSCGDDPKQLGEFAWTEENCDEKPHPVGKKKANPWGLYDMHGNVAEWCIDRYNKDYYGTLPRDRLSLNPFNPPTDNRYGYVARGGSWFDKAEKCRSAARLASVPQWNRRDPRVPHRLFWLTEADYVGFRIVRSVTEDERLTGIRSLVGLWSPD